ncbi:TldD protein [Clostridium amylolyticum]|uniref:TldD protein n=1 Tax=Clostridium amylolyticum TaxID=1121298 RepID=A0A1M6PL43_9CLOT|nr:TldD/PmbA family protein [Clostridium amylolyticum]SHK08577.1 TldD protein [Clostridium amylolyticum]
MFKFPENLYSDVRIEEVSSTNIAFLNGQLNENTIREYKGAFIRVFDGQRWYYSSITDVSQIQQELDNLAKMAKPSESIYENPVVKKYEVNKGEYLNFQGKEINKVSYQEKVNLLRSYFNLLENVEEIKMWRATYLDNRKVKKFYSSKGASLLWDYQTCGVSYRFGCSTKEQDKTTDGSYQTASNCFEDLKDIKEELKEKINTYIDFMYNKETIEPGEYTVILSPLAAGVFAHESFGHNSEADFMQGDENAKEQWCIGAKMASDILSIIDYGGEMGSGYVTFDDEGSKAEKTYLIKDGILTGRLHNASTAADFNENLTGNARAINFEYEPIVRMTTTYIDKGNKTKEELIGEVKDGILIEDINHGSGMTTFTLAPNLAYRIRDGKIAEPLSISVITGKVMETLNKIDGVSDTIELLSFVTGGCGKMEQFPLPVGFGGPYVRVNGIRVQ